MIARRVLTAAAITAGLGGAYAIGRLATSPDTRLLGENRRLRWDIQHLERLCRERMDHIKVTSRTNATYFAEIQRLQRDIDARKDEK